MQLRPVQHRASASRHQPMADGDLSHGAAWSQLSPVARAKFLCTAKEFVDKPAKAVTLWVGVETEANWGNSKVERPAPGSRNACQTNTRACGCNPSPAAPLTSVASELLEGAHSICTSG